MAKSTFLKFIKSVSKKLTLPLFLRYVARIKKTNWPTVQKVGFNELSLLKYGFCRLQHLELLDGTV